MNKNYQVKDENCCQKKKETTLRNVCIHQDMIAQLFHVFSKGIFSLFMFLPKRDQVF
jgi:hypothetical protein